LIEQRISAAPAKADTAPLSVNGVISHRRAIFLLPYKSALNQSIAQTVGLFPVQAPIDFGGPYSRVRPDQRKHLFQVATLAALFR